MRTETKIDNNEVKPLKHIFTFLLVTSLFSCSKQDTYVKVTAYDYTTNAPLKNYNLYVYEKHVTNQITGDNGTYNLVTEGFTDDNGYKDFGEFDCRMSSRYDYKVTNHSLPSSYNSNNSYGWRGRGSESIKKGEVNNIRISN